MKVGEQRGTYSAQLRAYNEQKYKLSVQQNELKEKMQNTENGAVVYANEAATLELQYQAVSEKYDEYKEYMDKIMAQWQGKYEEVSTKQQSEAAKDEAEEMGKILTVARRIMHGDIVPANDEKKLMEFDGKLYQMAKNIGMMRKMEKRKKYKSLWEDEEEKEKIDPLKAADDQELTAGDGPEIVSVQETMDMATGGESGGESAESFAGGGA